MEAFGAYNVKLNNQKRFIIPVSFLPKGTENLYAIDYGENALICDNQGFQFKIRATEDTQLRALKARSYAKKLETGNGFVVPGQFRNADSFRMKSMVIWGKDSNFLLLNPKDFKDMAEFRDLSVLNCRRPFLVPNSIENTPLDGVDINKVLALSSNNDKNETGQYISLSSLGYRKKEKVYCIMSSLGLQVYRESTIMELLCDYPPERRKSLTDIVFPITLDARSRIKLPEGIDKIVCPSGVSVIQITRMGMLISNPQLVCDEYQNISEFNDAYDGPRLIKQFQGATK